MMEREERTRVFEVTGINPATNEPVTAASRDTNRMDAKAHAQEQGLTHVVVRPAPCAGGGGGGHGEEAEVCACRASPNCSARR
jgi:hypothetical protein